MPVYLIHGFRWPRHLVRAHVEAHGLKSAVPEWIEGPRTSAALIASFRSLFPSAMHHLSDLRLIEQHDVAIESRRRVQPYAYVADTVHEVRLSADVDEIRGRGVSSDAWVALTELRDKLAPEERVAWFIVVCDGEGHRVSSAAKLLQGKKLSWMASDVAGSRRDAEGGEHDGSRASGLKKWLEMKGVVRVRR